MKHDANPSGKSPRGNGKSFLADFIPGWLNLGSWLTGTGFFLAGFVGALILGWVLFPMALYSEQQQPLDFNHALHMNPEKVFGIEGETEEDRCLFCHRFREDGTFAGIPKIADCMMCHDDADYPLGESDAEKRFLNQYVAKDKEIPWLSYYEQPDCVYFSHIAHVKMAALDCMSCHGEHGNSESLPVYQANRLTDYSRNIWGKHISGYKANPWDRMKMDDCAECHTEYGVEENNACFVCHK